VWQPHAGSVNQTKKNLRWFLVHCANRWCVGFFPLMSDWLLAPFERFDRKNLFHTMMDIASMLLRDD